MNIIEKYDRPFEYAGIVLNILVAFQFYQIWNNSQPADVNKIYTLTVLIVFEAVLVHSGVLMATLKRKAVLFIIIPFYGLFAYVLSLSLEEQSILILYLFIVLNRMRFVFLEVPDAIRKRAIAKSALVASFFFLMLMAFMIYQPTLPKLSLTQDFLVQSGYSKYNIRAIFFSSPHIVVGFGFIYYCFLVLVEAFFVNRTFDENSIINIPE